jgi:hypothetical protein
MAADAELAEYFTSAIGVRAQCYDAGGSSAYNPTRGDDELVAQLERADVQRHDVVALTLAQLLPAEQRVLELVYAPRSAPTWLADALSPVGWRGSYVALAATLPRGGEALRKRHPSAVICPGAILTFLQGQGRGAADALLGKLRADCAAIHGKALAAYDVVRIERVRGQTTRLRAERKAAESARLARLDEELGRIRRRQAERFDSRLRGTA